MISINSFIIYEIFAIFFPYDRQKAKKMRSDQVTLDTDGILWKEELYKVGTCVYLEPETFNFKIKMFSDSRPSVSAVY